MKWNICNYLGKQYRKSWECVPNTNIKNASYKIKPALLVKHKKANQYNTTVYCTVDRLRVTGGVRNYTMNDNLTLEFKFSRCK